MLKLLPQQTPEPFNGSLIHFARSFRRQRRKSSYKLQNRRIAQIHFHTFRHWKATMEYHRTKDILYVKQLLGHKSIQNTMKYTQLMDFKDDEFTCKVAETIKELKNSLKAVSISSLTWTPKSCSGNESSPTMISLSGGDCRWGRGDLNPGSPAPQAGILDQTRDRLQGTRCRP